MGLGIAKLLQSENYRIVTNITGRSAQTHERARSINVELLSSDVELVKEADYILSIVPPRDAELTANRVIAALSSKMSASSRQPGDERPLYYLDLNAISPRTAKRLEESFKSSPFASSVVFIDGGIIGGPPSHKEGPPPSTTSSHPPAPPGSQWTKPSIPVSGPFELSDAKPSGAHLSETLNIKHISNEIGPAAGLKMCFASTTKGFTAIAIQAFTTAQNLGVLPHLERELQDFAPASLNTAKRGITSMPPKAYRWVREMEEIADTHAEEAGFDRTLFEGVAGVYRVVAEETGLGGEKGLTVGEVVGSVAGGLRGGRGKKEGTGGGS